MLLVWVSVVFVLLALFLVLLVLRLELIVIVDVGFPCVGVNGVVSAAVRVGAGGGDVCHDEVGAEWVGVSMFQVVYSLLVFFYGVGGGGVGHSVGVAIDVGVKRWGKYTCSCRFVLALGRNRRVVPLCLI